MRDRNRRGNPPVLFCRTVAVGHRTCRRKPFVLHQGAAPTIHRFENREKAFSQRCQGIIDTGRNDRINCAGNQTVFFQLAELLGQHFRRRFGYETVQLVEAQRLTGQVPEQQRFIFAAD